MSMKSVKIEDNKQAPREIFSKNQKKEKAEKDSTTKRKSDRLGI